MIHKGMIVRAAYNMAVPQNRPNVHWRFSGLWRKMLKITAYITKDNYKEI
jgi:hypothetical protein